MFHSFNKSCQISSTIWAHSYLILFTVTQETCGSILHSGFLNPLGVSWRMDQSWLIFSIHSSSTSPASSQDSALSIEWTCEPFALSSKTHFSPACPTPSPDIFYLHCPTTQSGEFYILSRLLIYSTWAVADFSNSWRIFPFYFFLPSCNGDCCVSTCILDFTLWKQNLGRRNLSSTFYAICHVSPIL